MRKYSGSHKTLKVGRNPGRSSSPTASLRPVSFNRVSESMSSQVLKITKGGDSTTSKQAVPVFKYSHSKKKLFLMFKQNFVCLRVCSLSLVLILDTAKANLPPFSLLCPHTNPGPSLLQFQVSQLH